MFDYHYTNISVVGSEVLTAGDYEDCNLLAWNAM
jgi:hypothetical protein